MSYNQGGYQRKKSLLIGINYVGSQHELQGCHQDVTNMREFLDANGAAAPEYTAFTLGPHC
jgi:hypothetical protein